MFIKWKKVKILNLYDDFKKLKICEEEIKNEINTHYSHFNKCIELKVDLLAISDDDSIHIWKNNDKKYVKIKEIKLNEDPSDLLLINNNYFIASLFDSKKVFFYNISNFEKTEEISNIDSINSDNCLLLYKNNYIFVNCIKGIAVIYAETKQLIQYIENFEGYDNKKICIDNNENIAIFNYSNKNLSIMKLFFEEGNFISVEEYKHVKFEEENNNSYYDKKIDCMFLNEDNSIIIFVGENIYVLKDKN